MPGKTRLSSRAGGGWVARDPCIDDPAGASAGIRWRCAFTGRRQRIPRPSSSPPTHTPTHGAPAASSKKLPVFMRVSAHEGEASPLRAKARRIIWPPALPGESGQREIAAAKAAATTRAPACGDRLRGHESRTATFPRQSRGPDCEVRLRAQRLTFLSSVAAPRRPWLRMTAKMTVRHPATYPGASPCAARDGTTAPSHLPVSPFRLPSPPYRCDQLERALGGCQKCLRPDRRSGRVLHPEIGGRVAED
jgi:hypothetical protein